MNTTDRQLTKIANDAVLVYFQSWGQSIMDRINALQRCVDAALINATFIQNEDTYGWDGPDADLGKQFRAELEECFPRGQFELEAKAVEKLIRKWRDREGVK